MSQVVIGAVAAIGYLLWKFGYTMCCNIGKWQIWRQLLGTPEPDIVIKDRGNWEKPHQLFFNSKHRQFQLNQLQHFNKRLHMCYMSEKGFKHFFITDGTWKMEFTYDTGVMVHNSQLEDYVITDDFFLTPDVLSRMQKVCGATNFSFAFRNSEHLARYIHSGAWLSYQMTGSGEMKKILFAFLEENQSLVNKLPTDLKTEEVNVGNPIYEEVGNYHVTFEQSKTHMDEDDNDAYNIIFLGPTGSGKSTLINHLFNQKVVKAEANVHSVTREIQYTRGKLIWAEDHKWDKRDQVNIIDTVGFCDTELSASEVHNAIQSSVKTHVTYIDKVVMVCSGRIEPPMVLAMKKMMKWLRYEKYKKNFVFIYNKSDSLSDFEKEESLETMSSLLGADPNLNFVVPSGYDSSQKSVKLTQAIGFAPLAGYEEVKEDLQALKDAVFSYDTEIHQHRIPVDKGLCAVQ